MKLKELREAQKISQRELAQRLEISQVNYNRYENELIQPDIATLCKMADYFEVSIDTIVGRKNQFDIGYLTPNQKNIVVMAKKLNETNQLQAIGYIAGLLANQG